MSWLLRFVPFVLLTACGGTTVNHEGDGGANRVPMQHRPSAVTCGTPPAARDAGAPAGPSPQPETCMTDADCTSGANGRCTGGRIGLYCTYDLCFSDKDCDPGAVCTCGGSSASNRCLAPGCQVDSDCPGSFCSPTFGSCGDYLGVIAYRCHTAADECVDDADCAGTGPNAPVGYCAFDPMVDHWACSYSQCAG